MLQANQPRDGSWQLNSSLHWAGAERRDQGEMRKGARTEEAELVGVNFDEQLPAQRGCRPGHTSEGGQGELVALYVGYNIIIYQAIVVTVCYSFSVLCEF